MRPVLKPGLYRAWRDRATLQIGATPRRAFALTGLTRPLKVLLEGLDGTRDHTEVFAYAAAVGVDDETTARLLDLLSSQGALDDAAESTSALLRLQTVERQRLGPDVASLALLGERPGEGLRRLEARRQAAVEVHGAGRVGSVVACSLAACGVGHVLVCDPRPTTPADLAPGGLGADAVGAARDRAVTDIIRRLAPSVSTALPPDRAAPDLAVVAPEGNRADPVVSHTLLRRGVPHLYAAVTETTGVVGPLVLPGRSSCLQCHDLYRTDRDPAWPTVLAQLLRNGPQLACDTALASAVAAHATLQALAHLEGAGAVMTVDGTLELSLEDGRMRRRGWQPHPSCGCRWAEHSARAESAPPAS